MITGSSNAINPRKQWIYNYMMIFATLCIYSTPLSPSITINPAANLPHSLNEILFSSIYAKNDQQ